MTCSYCGSRNPDGEHRCGRCGRKPSDTLTPAGLHVTHGALAAQPSYYAQPERYAEPATPVDLTRAVQGALFPERPASNVIPIESFAATRPETPRRSRQAAKPAAKPNGEPDATPIAKAGVDPAAKSPAKATPEPPPP